MKKQLVTLFFTGVLLQLAYGQGAGKALRFDGNDYVRVNNSATIQLGNELTISCWVYFPDVASGTGQVILRKWISSDGGWGSYTIYRNPGNALACNVQNQTLGSYPGWTTTAGLAAGQWHHIAFVYRRNAFNSTDGIIYANGIPMATTFDPSPGGYPSNFSIEYNTRELYMGRPPTAFGAYYTGILDEMQLWNRALTQEEIRHKMCERQPAGQSSLQAYWRMDEGTDDTCPGGQDVCDASGKGNHGVKF
ncbi:MAG: LamG domain-containing protein [Bacteroidetes bacterium]|nr:LamG domain-containing protein [Bacteroidota bacterium]